MFNAGYIVFAFIFYKLGVWKWRMSVTDARAKGAGCLYYALLVFSFSIGWFARTFEQLTGSQWANALVPVSAGLFMLAFVWPLVFLPRQQPLPPMRRILSWTATGLITVLAVLFFFIGFNQMLAIQP